MYRWNQTLTCRSTDWEWVQLPWREPQTGGKVLSHRQSCPDPHPLRQCNLTVVLTQTNVRIRYASFPPMTSHMMSSVWVGDGYLIQTHHRATTPPQTHTQTIPLHTSRPPIQHSFSMPPTPSLLPVLPAVAPAWLSAWAPPLQNNQVVSGTRWHHNDFACSSKTGHSLHVVLHLGYPITRAFLLVWMGSIHFSEEVVENTCNHKTFRVKYYSVRRCMLYVTRE